ncbi:PEP-utilizing enzyme [Vibrio owensii]|uniref:PEP-utilizing enzyme n=1 Tax=Vibrio owensii TaxID=696485 RepID=UPI003CC50695
MIKVNSKAIALAALLLAAPCYAFPVVEGASVIGSLAGVLCSLMVGLMPSTSKNIKLVTGMIVILFLSLAYIGADVKSDMQQSAIDEFAHLSRPILPSPAEAIKRSQQKELVYDQELFEFSQSSIDQNLSLEKYYVEREYAELYPVFLDYVPGGFNFKPERFAENVEVTDIEKLTEIVERHNGKVALFSSQSTNLEYAAKAAYERTGHRLFKVSLPEFGFSDDEKIAEMELNTDLWFQDYDNVYTENLIDVRSAIEELNTLENAINVSVLDFYVMTDAEITEFLGSIDNPIFVSYHPHTYTFIHDRLKRLNLDYKMLKGGLDELYDRDYTITPMYLNISRELDPYEVMRDYSESRDLKFICIEEAHCLNNLPVDDTYYFSIRQNGREAVKAKLEELPKNHRYITVSTNLETYGNSVLAGYWLNQSDHTYVGMFSHSDRFSLDFIHIDMMDKQNLLLSEYQEKFSWKQNLIHDSTEFVSEFTAGWVVLFLALGAVFRSVLAPIQMQLSKSYYFKHSQAKTGVASIVLLLALVWAYTGLNGLILNHGLVSHLEITSFEHGVKTVMAALFASMIIFQLSISFPRNRRLKFSMMGLIVGVYLCGLIDHIVTPILFFLIGSELVAILIQLPYYAQYRVQEKLPGIYFTNYLSRDDSLPEKWRLVNEFNDAEGFLVSKQATDNSILQAIEFEFESMSKGLYLVRSCANDIKESALGGYHESLIVEREDILKTSKAMLDSDLDFVWVQPYYQTKHNGVITSISSDAEGIHLAYGQGDSATEGGKGCLEKVLSQEDMEFFKELKLLKAVEKHFESPVQIEFGRTHDDEIILYQVRLLDPLKYEVSKLYKLGKQGIQLHESYLVRSTRMTGSILEEVSNRSIIHVAGYNYLSLKSGYESLYVTKRQYRVIEEKLLSLQSRFEQGEGPLSTMSMIDELIVLYRQIFKLTQSRNGFNEIDSPVRFCQFGAVDGNDLEICAERAVLKHPVLLQDKLTYARRDALHNLIVWVNHMLSKLLKEYSTYIGLEKYSDYTLSQLKQIGAVNRFEPLPYSPSSLFEEQSQNGKVIVEGDIEGRPFDIEGVSPEGFMVPDNEKLILVGEEIPSGWVKHLHRFSGIYSIYGHSASHLAISAREMGIPYRTLTRREYEDILSS